VFVDYSRGRQLPGMSRTTLAFRSLPLVVLVPPIGDKLFRPIGRQTGATHSFRAEQVVALEKTMATRASRRSVSKAGLLALQCKTTRLAVVDIEATLQAAALWLSQPGMGLVVVCSDTGAGWRYPRPVVANDRLRISARITGEDKNGPRASAAVAVMLNARRTRRTAL
jgi:hypothetical protein